MNQPLSVHDLLGLFDEEFIDQLYRTVLGREPDPTGRLGHVEQLRRGHPKEALIAHFALSAEGKANAARIEGLADLCERTKAPDVGLLSGWLAARTQAAGLVAVADVAAMENRLGRKLQALQVKLDRVVARSEVVEQGATENQKLPPWADGNTAELYRRMVQLGQVVARLDERLGRFEQQLERAERESVAVDSRQRAKLAAVLSDVGAALERIETRLKVGPATASVPDK